jgi:hypothetical protein
MISSEQEKQIALYLISKKLHSQIIIEVKDHFISQISNLMETKNISFQEAFLETQVSWKNELEMVRADFFSFRKITRLEKNILQPIFRRMMVFALGISLAIGIVLSLNENLYLCAQGILLLVYIGFSLYNFAFKKMKFSEYQRMSFHPLLLRNILLMLIVVPATHMIFESDDILWKSPFNHMFLTYAILIQIQLLYFRNKKINVLLT